MPYVTIWLSGEEAFRLRKKYPQYGSLSEVVKHIVREALQRGVEHGGNSAAKTRSSQHSNGGKSKTVPDEFYQAFKRRWKARDQAFSEEDIFDWSF